MTTPEGENVGFSGADSGFWDAQTSEEIVVTDPAQPLAISDAIRCGFLPGVHVDLVNFGLYGGHGQPDSYPGVRDLPLGSADLAFRLATPPSQINPPGELD